MLLPRCPSSCHPACLLSLSPPFPLSRSLSLSLLPQRLPIDVSPPCRPPRSDASATPASLLAAMEPTAVARVDIVHACNAATRALRARATLEIDAHEPVRIEWRLRCDARGG
eukprot:672351-Pleurochrysis_carterae.AAC.1